jgi:hypothetical protein
MSELQAQLHCSCGRSVVARAPDAGGTIKCNCGKSVPVPPLSKLRTLSGSEAYITNPVEAIRKAQREGNDPAGDKCVVCHSANPTFYRCHAVCEQSHIKRTAASDDDSTAILRWLFFPLILNVILSFMKRDTTIDRQGHDIEIVFQLPVCDPCSKNFGKPTRPSVAKQIMRNVPLYQELLDYYPGARLRIERI